MAKIKEIEPGRFLSKDNMNVVKGGETCSVTTLYAACAVPDKYSTWAGTLLTCAPAGSYISKPCALYETCGAPEGGLFESCSGYLFTCSPKYSFPYNC